MVLLLALHGKLDSVCKKLQNTKRTMTEVRTLFDACIAEYPVMEEDLSATAEIVQSGRLRVGHRQADECCAADERRAEDPGALSPPSGPAATVRGRADGLCHEGLSSGEEAATLRAWHCRLHPVSVGDPAYKQSVRTFVLRV